MWWYPEGGGELLSDCLGRRTEDAGGRRSRRSILSWSLASLAALSLCFRMPLVDVVYFDCLDAISNPSGSRLSSLVKFITEFEEVAHGCFDHRLFH